jgi:hypothetical protein
VPTEGHTPAPDPPRTRSAIFRALAGAARAIAGARTPGSPGPLEEALWRAGQGQPAALPRWVTLDVVHRGYAKGEPAAGGPLQPHEREALASLPGGSGRGELNRRYLAEGRHELLARLADGCYRIRAPEEAALLVVAWLVEQGAAEEAERLVRTISPYFDELRFFPAPHPRPLPEGATAFVWSAGQAAARLRARTPQPQVERMAEALQVWTPLLDRAVALFLETVVGDPPSLRTAPDGALLRRPDGQPVVQGGWPCRVYPAGWTLRAARLLEDLASAHRRGPLCGKPGRPKENLARLRAALERCLVDPGALTGREVGMVRHALAAHATRHGEPYGARLERTRAAQQRDAARPRHHRLAAALAARLERQPPEEGVPGLEELLAPLEADEAAAIAGARPGEAFPAHLVTRARTCLEAPLGALVEQGLVRSAEELAALLPPRTARVRATAIGDPAMRRVFACVYAEFQRRRSLLRTNQESQVDYVSDLPWIAPILPRGLAIEASRKAARDVLYEVGALAVTAFPQAAIPDRLVRELRTLAGAANIHPALVDRIHAYAPRAGGVRLRAAQTAAQLLAGTVYERYFGIPYAAVRELRSGVGRGEKALADLCHDRAVATGCIVAEQWEIVTTENLSVLFVELGLARDLRPSLARLARGCFQWTCHRLQRETRGARSAEAALRAAGTAWRQMVFYLAPLAGGEVGEVLAWCQAHLDRQRPAFRARFAPALAGLRAAAAGAQLPDRGPHPAGGRRFLGTDIARHWLA